MDPGGHDLLTHVFILLSTASDYLFGIIKDLYPTINP
jgi:hypothetical protein